MEGLTAAAEKAAASSGFPLWLLAFLALALLVVGWLLGRSVPGAKKVSPAEQREADKRALMEERARRRAIRVCDAEDAQRQQPPKPRRW